jgi:hypothetical protein
MVFEITVPESIAERAKRAVERMIEIAPASVAGHTSVTAS